MLNVELCLQVPCLQLVVQLQPTSLQLTAAGWVSSHPVFRSSVHQSPESMCLTYVEMYRIYSRKPVSQASSKFYVKLNINDLSSIGTSLLESVLLCNILGYWIIRSFVLKVKFFESNLLTALTSGNQNGHHASIWQKDMLLIPNKSSPRPPTVSNKYTKSINLLSWNCRVLFLNVPYSFIWKALSTCTVRTLVMALWVAQIKRYLRQLCSHWWSRLKHLMEVGGSVVLPFYGTRQLVPPPWMTLPLTGSVRFVFDPNNNRSTIGVYLPCSNQVVTEITSLS